MAPTCETALLSYRRLSCGCPPRHTWDVGGQLCDVIPESYRRLSNRCPPVQQHSEILVPNCGINYLDPTLDWAIGAHLLKLLTWAYRRLRFWCPPMETSQLSSVGTWVFCAHPFETPYLSSTGGWVVRQPFFRLNRVPLQVNMIIL